MINRRQRRTPSVTYSSHYVPIHLHDFVKTYLYRLYTKALTSDQFEVISMIGGSSDDFFVIRQITVSDEENSDNIRVTDKTIFATVRFNKRIYQLAIMDYKRFDDNRYFLIQAQGLDPQSRFSNSLLEQLKIEATKFSPYNNATLEVVPNSSSESARVDIRPIVVQEDSLNELFMPDEIKSHISLFTKTLENFQKSKRSMRYLFSGKPGTAKTKIIRSIANACKGKATFIFTNGNEHRIDELFELTKLFAPVVICIDDIDLMTGSRQEGIFNKVLAAFLQKMDGFTDSNFFLLATTNDKNLVDIAASRPGRFDMIIDVNQIESKDYLALVKSKTKSEEVITLFDDSILALLKTKKVTGAFIANLVKHLELMSIYSDVSLNPEYIEKAVKDYYDGFYSVPAFDKKVVGFN